MKWKVPAWEHLSKQEQQIFRANLIVGQKSPQHRSVRPRWSACSKICIAHCHQTTSHVCRSPADRQARAGNDRSQATVARRSFNGGLLRCHNPLPRGNHRCGSAADPSGDMGTHRLTAIIRQWLLAVLCTVWIAFVYVLSSVTFLAIAICLIQFALQVWTAVSGSQQQLPIQSRSRKSETVRSFQFILVVVWWWPINGTRQSKQEGPVIGRSSSNKCCTNRSCRVTGVDV